MATKSKKRVYVKLRCDYCKEINYLVKKSKGQDIEKKLSLSKFCKRCRAHQIHKEIKK
ncbi:MAG: 50S ribosomal protein L33 [Candidatus Pacebacteria bacterium]|nr:50S ribosomal protein L33 [Candidatus Paceibacterota bacterium]